MRLSPLVLGIFLAAVAIAPRAQAQNYPWCAHYGKGGGDLNCGFTTWDQCMATVSGIGGFCEVNNTYVPAAATASPHRQARHKAHKAS